MKWLKILTIVLIVLIVGSITVTAILAGTYSRNEGSVEGTGFIIQEINGAGDIRYDVDDDGNIYFAVTSPRDSGIVIYDKDGAYLYTLPISTAGALFIKIDDNNNILVYFIRQNKIKQYNSKGILINTIEDEDRTLEKSFPHLDKHIVRNRNGIRYVNKHGTITKEENGVKTIVFTVPVWQIWFRAFRLIMILSIVALFLRIAIPQWRKAFRERYGA